VSLDADLAALRDADAAIPSPVPLPIGALASVVAGAVRGLTDADWWVPGLRERAGAVLRGVAVDAIGDGTAGSRAHHVAPASPTPALRALHAVGLAAASPDAAVVVHLGVGSLADGAFTEALNLAALRQVRVIFVVAVIDLTGAPVPRQSAASVAALAAAYGVRCVEVDGRDASAVRQAVSDAREQIGPTCVAAVLNA
jgi:TPP-dependent pyruvate/acetoin dehydrogenase alpha subunit